MTGLSQQVPTQDKEHGQEEPKEKNKTQSPDSPEATVNNIPCDQCGHPKSFHRQKKYYCMAEVLYNDPINNNEPIKAMCSCTNFANAEQDEKKKKDKEQKEKDKDKEKEQNVPKNQEAPKSKDKDKDKTPKPLVPSETEPIANVNTGGTGVTFS